MDETERGRRVARRRNDALGLFEIPLVDVVEELGHDAYGLMIGRKMSKRIGARVPQAQVYSTLKRLARRGLIEHSETRVVRGSPPLKVYEVTDAGRRARAVAARQYNAAFQANGEVNEYTARRTASAQGGGRRR